MTVTIDRRGAVVEGKTFREGVVIAADDVRLEDCVVDCAWATEEPYGIKVAADPEGRPYRRTTIEGCTVRNVYRKGIVIGWGSVTNCKIHDVGSDGVILQPWGRVLIADNHIHSLGKDEWSRVAGQDRDGRPLHADGIQATGGPEIDIRRNVLELAQGYPGIERVGNACVYVECNFGDVTGLRVIGNTCKGANHLIRIRDEIHGFHVMDAKVARNKLIEPWAAALILETQYEVAVANNDWSEAEPRKRR